MKQDMEAQASQGFSFERLGDPYGDRHVKDLPLPPDRPVGISQVYPQFIKFGDIARPNPKLIREVLLLDGSLDKKSLLKLIGDAERLFRFEPNMVEVTGEVVMIGDIHGQFFDMVEMLDSLTPRLDADTNFHLVFMGDYVDRGVRCVEVLAYLLALKANYPKRIILLRGNHESRSMTEHFTFRQECIDKYDLETYEAFIGMFDCLPLAATVNGLYLCIHGGISPDLARTADINERVDRF